MRTTAQYSVAILALGAGLCVPMQAQPAIEPEAMQALNQMGAYLRSLKAFQIQADVTEELVLDSGEKLQFSSRHNFLARMPDKLLITVDGDRRTRSYVYDGKTFTFFAQRAGYYASMAAPPTVGQLAEVLSEKYGIDVPLEDLFRWGGPKLDTSAITSANDVGPAQVGGVSCEHYAFRQPGLDWQVWLQKGDSPLPRKLVLTTTTDEARPQHVSVLTWNLAPSYSEATFVFDPPPGATKIVFAEAGKN